MKMKTENSENLKFKAYAKEAVSRMKHGFWEDVAKQKKNATNRATSTLQKSQVKQSVSKTYSDETEFEKRVYALLEEDELSPIGKLIDKEKYQEMSLEEKGRYVLGISNKFVKIKEKYNKEKIESQKEYAK